MRDALAGKREIQVNPHKSWYRNLDEMTNGDYEVTFIRSARSLIRSRCASGQSPVYPCRTVARRRTHQLAPAVQIRRIQANNTSSRAQSGLLETGPPLSRRVETTIIPRVDAAAGVCRRQIRHDPADHPAAGGSCAQAPQAAATWSWTTLTATADQPAKPPFDNLELRRAMALSLDQALSTSSARVRGAVGARSCTTDGVWGMPPGAAQLRLWSGSGEKPRKPATSCKKLGMGRLERLAVKVSTRDVPGYRDAAVIAIAAQRSISMVSSSRSTPQTGSADHPQDYTIRVTVSEGGLDGPDQKFYETYVCGAAQLHHKLLQRGAATIDQQSMSRSLQAPQARHRRSNANWRRTPPGRYCYIRGLPRACSRGSRADDDDQQPL
jgi:peptide/nickel transport system substrate-binding protein